MQVFIGYAQDELKMFGVISICVYLLHVDWIESGASGVKWIEHHINMRMRTVLVSYIEYLWIEIIMLVGYSVSVG